MIALALSAEQLHCLDDLMDGYLRIVVMSQDERTQAIEARVGGRTYWIEPNGDYRVLFAADVNRLVVGLECEHRWRDYSEHGGDFERTPVVCRDCGAEAPPEIRESVLTASRSLQRESTERTDAS